MRFSKNKNVLCFMLSRSTFMTFVYFGFGEDKTLKNKNVLCWDENEDT